ncbi:MAG: response regulator [Bacteroidota bacterium]|nr:response regulator [Bacteroidota bacterium]
MDNRKELKVLLLEDNRMDMELIKRQIINGLDFIIDLNWVANEKDFVAALSSFGPDIILSDYSLPGFNGLQALEHAKNANSLIPFIIVTGSISEEKASNTIKVGVWEYVTKERLYLLPSVIKSALIRKDERDKLLEVKLCFNESEEKYYSLFSKMAEGLYFHDIIYDDEGQAVNYRIIDCNPASEILLGIKREDAVNKLATELYGTERAPYLEIYSKVAATGEAISFEEFFPAMDMHFKISAFSPAKGKFATIFSDITKSKKDEKVRKILFNISNAVTTTLNINEYINVVRSELANVIDTTNFFIALYDKQSKTISLPFFSDQKDSFKSFPIKKTLTGYVIKTKKPLLANAKIKKKLAQLGEIEHVGTISKIWLGVPLIIESKVIGVVAVQSYENEDAFGHDDMELLEQVSHHVSILLNRRKGQDEQNNLQQNLEKALKKSKESDQLKSAFLATMSHEIRTPLNAVIGFSDMITDEMDMADIIEMAKLINQNGYDLLKIIESIFEISMIQSKVSSVEIEIFSIADFFTSIKHEINTRLLKLNKPELTSIYEPDPKIKNLRIKTDKKKLLQLISKFVSNATKFADKGEIKYGFNIKNNDIEFFVSDTGIGIPKEKLDIIFEKFRQIDDAYTRKYGGIGLGLAICKELCQILNGKLRVDSEEGKGSTFYFTLNDVIIRPEDGVVNGNLPELSFDFSGKTFLIAEDMESNYLFLKRMLNKTNAKIFWVQNGLDAVSMTKDNSEIDLVLMDIRMPIMDGHEATRQIKAIRPKVIVIAQTAFAMQSDKEKALESGCDDYISKPIKKDVLLNTIKKQLDSTNSLVFTDITN